jgi:hypothetical protein
VNKSESERASVRVKKRETARQSARNNAAHRRFTSTVSVCVMFRNSSEKAIVKLRAPRTARQAYDPNGRRQMGAYRQ